eukprot:GSChrysophyteH1.ASY1.ANO1.1696.1 assembled CDS
MLRIVPKCQQYAWGKVGTTSLVAKLAKSDKPYAELWLGTHPSGPSTVASDGSLLSEWLKEHPGSDNLPFLLKVLSIKTALSIQAHPDKALAEELHNNFPDVYKDANHKPEMAIALTRFEGMNGFRPLAEISEHCTLFPEFAAILGKQTGTGPQQEKEALKTVLHSILHADQADPSFTADVMLRLHKDFPGDSGMVFPLALNTVALSPGEAMYLAANEPHAYISGDIVECMALSDNVVRAGLTPKFKDKATLERMLTYNCAEVAYCKPQELDSNSQLYRPPSAGFPEFEVECVKVPQSSSHDMVSHHCASMFIVTDGGDGTIFSTLEEDGGVGVEVSSEAPSVGASFFQKAGHRLRIRTSDSCGITLYRAHINLDAACADS